MMSYNNQSRMKKFYITCLALFALNSYTLAQDTCAGALSIVPSVQNVPNINSGQVPNPDCAENFGQLRTAGKWYVFTASVNGVAKVTSDLITNPTVDTRLHIYTGACSVLECIAGNDDKDPFGNVRFSEAIWPISSGITYYIAWDNQYSTSGFDFELTETAISCPSGSLPIASDFDNTNDFIACFSTEDIDGNGSDWKLQFVDMDGDGNDEDYATTGTNSNIAKEDWLFSPPIDLTINNSYQINFKYNGGNGTFPANETLEVILVDAASSSATVLQSVFTETGITRTGNFSQGEALATSQSIPYTSTVTGTYYLAFKATSPTNSGSLLLFDYSVTDVTLSNILHQDNALRHTYNRDTDMLTIASDHHPINTIKVFNILGQEVIQKSMDTKEVRIELSSLIDGIYLVRILSSNTISKTIKLLKL